MFVYKQHAVSLDGLLQVKLVYKGTSSQRCTLAYVNNCTIQVSCEMGEALLAKLASTKDNK